LKPPRLSSGLVARVLAIIVFSSLLTALGSFAFSTYAARGAFSNYVRRSTSMRQQYLVMALEQYHLSQKSWKGVEALISWFRLSRGGVPGPGPGMGMGPWPGGWGSEFDRLTLLDPNGAVIVDTAGALPGSRVVFEPWEAIQIRPDNTLVGLLLLGTPDERARSAGLYHDFIRAITGGTLYSALGAAVLALVLGYWVTGRTLKPIQTLTEATREIGKGNLAVRVNVSGNDEISQLARSFNVMSAALEEAERKRRELVADVAHELRTPLTVLKSNLEGIEDGVVQWSPDLLGTLSGEVERLSRLVSDLHVLALADAGRLEPNLEPVDCARLLARTADAFGPVAASCGVSLHVAGDENLTVLGDPVRLGQVLSNLVDNSIRYTPAGGRITLAAEEAGDGDPARVVLVIEDTGEGIPEPDIPHIFERFYRGDKSRSRKTGGSGLGLAIAHDIVKAHSGTISVTSAPGKGARFAIVLPRLDLNGAGSE